MVLGRTSQLSDGSSGARIVDNGDGTVTKLDTEVTGGRVRDQGVWLVFYQLHRPEWRHLPRVSVVLQNGYIMEKLHTRSWQVYGEFELGQVSAALAAELWREPPHARIDRVAHAAYVAKLLGDVDRADLVESLTDITPELRWDVIHSCLTHGDAIIDNLVYRSSAGSLVEDDLYSGKTGVEEPTPVLLDPIPATSALPDILASDVGRLVQSASGYESIIHDTGFWRMTSYDVARSAYSRVNVPLTDDEFTLTLYFALIHTLRGLRTALRRRSPQVVRLLSEQVNRAHEELVRWMP